MPKKTLKYLSKYNTFSRLRDKLGQNITFSATIKKNGML